MQTEFKDERAIEAQRQSTGQKSDTAMAAALYATDQHAEAAASDLSKFRPAVGNIPGFGEMSLYPSELEADILALDLPAPA